MQTRREILKIRDLAVGYNSILLKGLNITLYEGDRILLSGPSGCGKTSLLRSVLGLFPPADGEIWIHGQRIEESSVWTLRRQIGYVPQEPELGDDTVRAFFERSFSFHANRSIHLDEQELSEQMGRWLLPHQVLEKSCLDLSGGEKQRVSIILTILLKRKILLLDEPTSALDKDSRRVLYDWIQDSGELSFLIVSHEPNLREIAGQSIDLSACRPEAVHG